MAGLLLTTLFGTVLMFLKETGKPFIPLPLHLRN